MKKLWFLAFVCLTTAVFVFLALANNGKQDKRYLILVNKTHRIPAKWESQVMLVTDKDPWGNDVVIKEKTLKQFKKLQSALLDRGIDIYLDSVYRSVNDQIDLWDYFEKEYGEDYCKEYVAVPGYSEHHTGLAVDICINVDGEYCNDNDVMLAETELFRDIHQMLPNYGFILRYMKGKEDITGYSYEPWHLRYVGVKAAKEITKNGLTLEEYLGEAP